MLVFQTNNVGVELFSYVNAFFCSNDFEYMQATYVRENALYRIGFRVNNYSNGAGLEQVLPERLAERVWCT